MMIFHSYVSLPEGKSWRLDEKRGYLHFRKHPFAKFLVFQHPYFSGNIMLNHSQFKTLQVRGRQPQLHWIPHARTFWHYSLSRMTSSSLDQRSRGQTNKYSHEIPHCGWFHKWENMRTQYKSPDSIIFLAGSPANVDSLGITVWKITQNNLQPGGPFKKHEIYVIPHFCWFLVD
jgi:hypothetical protein